MSDWLEQSLFLRMSNRSWRQRNSFERLSQGTTDHLMICGAEVMALLISTSIWAFFFVLVRCSQCSGFLVSACNAAALFIYFVLSCGILYCVWVCFGSVTLGNDLEPKLGRVKCQKNFVTATCVYIGLMVVPKSWTQASFWMFLNKNMTYSIDR